MSEEIIRCSSGCGRETPRFNPDGSENALWECNECSVRGFNAPSDKNCWKCNKVLTNAEKKTCCGRSWDNPDFICNPCYANQNYQSEGAEYNRLNSLIENSRTLTELESNYQTVKTSPLYSSNKKTWAKNEDNKTELDKTYNTYKRTFCSSCLNPLKKHQSDCLKKCKKCNDTILENSRFKRCHNIDCENYWGKHNDINDIDNNPNQRERERERANPAVFHSTQYQIHHFTRK